MTKKSGADSTNKDRTPPAAEPRPTRDAERGRPREDRLDETLAETFPASDPPAWTPGIARVQRQVAGSSQR